jgi:hypothetical protein
MMRISVEQTLSKAKRLAQKGRADEAARLYREVIEAHPRNSRAKQALAAPGKGGDPVIRGVFRSRRDRPGRWRDALGGLDAR